MDAYIEAFVLHVRNARLFLVAVQEAVGAPLERHFKLSCNFVLMVLQFPCTGCQQVDVYLDRVHDRSALIGGGAQGIPYARPIKWLSLRKFPDRHVVGTA